jgi:Zn-dependent protease with chaperone function
MDFFQAQSKARRNTFALVLMFLAAVICIVIAVYLVIQLAFILNASTERNPVSLWDATHFWWVALATGGVILVASLFKTLQLSEGGGSAVAKGLGGRRLSRDTSDRLERRLLNIVEEMSIASGVIVPQVYLLDDEVGINAFAAGTEPVNAVVAVTRGCLERLTRDELQGVIGHEFSHILNGDMSLNIRLIGLLNGILFIALIGRTILRGSSDAKGFALVGLGMLLVGYIGVLFGNIIKAAVSRQREYMADASAVQFTRNPAGIAGALKKIAGIDTAFLGHARAEEASHMYFGAGVDSLFALFATHPPIAERIARLDPAFLAQAGRGMARESNTYFKGSEDGIVMSLSSHQMRERVGNLLGDRLDYARGLLNELPEAVTAELHDPQQAPAILFALIAAQFPNPEQVLIKWTDALGEAGRQRAIGHLPWLHRAGVAVRLPLFELLLPGIVALPHDELTRLRSDMARLIHGEEGLSLFGFALNALLRHALEERTRGERRARDLATIKRDVALLLSYLAHAGHEDAEQAQIAFDAAVASVLPGDHLTLRGRASLSTAQLDTALTHLDMLKPRFKGKLIESCVTAIARDGMVTLGESELLRAVGACLNCPVPPLMPGPYPGLAGDAAPVQPHSEVPSPKEIAASAINREQNPAK